jgi:hypothetical protein
MVCDGEVIGDIKAIDAAFAPPVVLAIVNEACARAARKKFRMASAGDEVKTQDTAADYVTKMLGITKASAPMTTESLLESEPARSVVLENCSRYYDYEWQSDSDDYYIEKEEIAWSRKIAIRWCHMFEMAKTFRLTLVHREGGWQQLERDMEISLDSYKDVAQALQNTQHCDSFHAKCVILIRKLPTEPGPQWPPRRFCTTGAHPAMTSAMFGAMKHSRTSHKICV